MSVVSTDTRLDRDHALAWYKKNRQRTSEIFALLTDDAYYQQPIALRHPIVFYDGHLPAFSLNTLVKKALGKPGFDERLERLFARGIDPEESGSSSPGAGWPQRQEVRAFIEEADRRVLDALANDSIDVRGHPLLDSADAVYTILEHEAMHQETLLYMWHRLPYEQKRRPASYHVCAEASMRRVDEEVTLPGGTVQVGAHRGEIPFGWDNEFGATTVTVTPFTVSRFNVTNGDYLEFVQAGGYSRPTLWSSGDWKWVQEQRMEYPSFWKRQDEAWYWRGMFELIPLPLDWPVYVSHAEARAYARWRGRRLMTEAEYQYLVTPFPQGGFYDFAGWEPVPVGTIREGCSEHGVYDLAGNGWEWTSTVFRPFPGFVPSRSYPEYSTDFFDESHYVMKGASPVTARELVRPTFRNWFRPRYPYVYATFRLAGDAA